MTRPRSDIDHHALFDNNAAQCSAVCRTCRQPYKSSKFDRGTISYSTMKRHDPIEFKKAKHHIYIYIDIHFRVIDPLWVFVD